MYCLTQSLNWDLYIFPYTEVSIWWLKCRFGDLKCSFGDLKGREMWLKGRVCCPLGLAVDFNALVVSVL